MASQNISTTEEGMRAAIQQFADKSAEFTSSKQSVDGQVDFLMTTWSGAAANGFRSAMDQWGESAVQVISALQTMQQQMEETLAGYAHGESEAESYMVQLNNGLPGFTN